ncbi:MerR family transcriptional regulator [Desulfuromonas versatilis]|uniref:MerR family transcriptional regulator n=1 Tax=Desulfuromonas versatilis TaxID=2802975 RepID=A0ABN6DVY3_9BACT|nr:PTS sugar transporter subunit IIA [Desulfuromonas versatilis]BCR03684.1 MerR family transcriptional regulator [Desulfuromonas versatilis]
MNLSVKDAARLLTVSEKTIYRWIKQEIVPAYKVNESYRFNRAELIEWATSRRMGLAADAFSEPETDAQPLPTLYEALEAGGVFYRIEGKNRDEVLADAVAHLRLPEEVDRGYLQQVLVAREQLASTAVGGGIAIPHPRSPGLLHVTRPTVTLCFLENPVAFHALDGKPVGVLLLIISPTLRFHLHLLSRVGFALQDAEFARALRSEQSREKIFAALAAAEGRFQG